MSNIAIEGCLAVEHYKVTQGSESVIEQSLCSVKMMVNDTILTLTRAL